MTRNSERGFTLVESLVALTVMMIVLAAIGGLSASSLRSGFYVERHIADVENAQQILAGLPSREALASKSMTGELATYRWRLDAEPFAANLVEAPAQTSWTPQKITVTVQGPGGGLMSFETIRLVRAGGK